MLTLGREELPMDGFPTSESRRRARVRRRSKEEVVVAELAPLLLAVVGAGPHTMGGAVAFPHHLRATTTIAVTILPPAPGVIVLDPVVEIATMIRLFAAVMMSRLLDVMRRSRRRPRLMLIRRLKMARVRETTRGLLSPGWA